MRALLCTTLALALAACADDSPSPVEPSSRPAAALAGAEANNLFFSHVSPGSYYSCGVATDGAAWCWGSGSSGPMGEGSDTFVTRLRPFPVAGGHRFLDVRTSGYTCGIATDHRAWCWGGNSVGNLGDGTTTSHSTPAPVSGDRRFRQIAVSADGHTCAVTTGNVLFCWGRNGFGQVGDGTTTERHAPVRIGGSLRFTEVSTGMLFTCGVTTDHRAYCWGWNRDGNLGDGTFTDYHSPHLVAGGHRFVEVSADAGAPGTHHACAVSTNNRIYCWGVNDAGQLGDGTNNNHFTPHLIPGGLRFATVSAGYYYTCAVTTDQRGYCWGAGDNFQLGTSPIHQSNTPIPVAGIHSFLEIRTGADHTCGVALNHRGLCWGENHFGQLGDGTTEPKQTPIVVGSVLP